MSFDTLSSLPIRIVKFQILSLTEAKEFIAAQCFTKTTDTIEEVLTEAFGGVVITEEHISEMPFSAWASRCSSEWVVGLSAVSGLSYSGLEEFHILRSKEYGPIMERGFLRDKWTLFGVLPEFGGLPKVSHGTPYVDSYIDDLVNRYGTSEGLVEYVSRPEEKSNAFVRAFLSVASDNKYRLKLAEKNAIIKSIKFRGVINPPPKGWDLGFDDLISVPSMNFYVVHSDKYYTIIVRGGGIYSVPKGTLDEIISEVTTRLANKEAEAEAIAKANQESSDRVNREIIHFYGIIASQFWEHQIKTLTSRSKFTLKLPKKFSYVTSLEEGRQVLGRFTAYSCIGSGYRTRPAEAKFLSTINELVKSLNPEDLLKKKGK